ncbi:MAG: hypothetical protein IJA90_00690 [Peptococcaceae bacterium]|nr:hypothetical protein [Peptococcaceae bacterium]
MFFFGKKRHETEAARKKAEAERKLEALKREIAADEKALAKEERELAELKRKKAEQDWQIAETQKLIEAERKAAEEAAEKKKVVAAEASQITRDEAFGLLCKALGEMGLEYTKKEEDYVVRFSAQGEHLPVKMILQIDVNHRVCLFSPMFHMPEDKRVAGVIMTGAASNDLVNGSFDYNIENRLILYRMTQMYEKCHVETAMFQEMIRCACAVVDRYDMDFLAVSRGSMSLEQFVKKHTG